MQKAEITIKKPMSRRKRLALIVFIVLIAGFAVYEVWEYIHTHRSIADIPEPIQIDLPSSEQLKTYTVHGADFGRPDYEMEMNYLAEYAIKGLVIGTKHMPDETAYDKSFPADVSLAWGLYAANRDAMECKNGPRKLSCTYKNEDLARIGANRSILNLVSNNHLSPSSSGIYDQIMRIRAGDYVEIKGYLVRVKVHSGSETFSATSSLVRTDRMDGSFDRTNTGCEMIYVTSIDWLD